MNKDTKKKVAEKILSLSKNEISVNTLELEETALGYEITGNILNDISMEMSIRSNGDIAMFKFEGVLKKEKEANLDVIAKDIVGDTGMNYTSYDGKYVFQKVVTFANTNDKDGESILVAAVKDIMDIIKSNQSKFVLDLSNVNVSETSSSDTKQSKDDEVDEEDLLVNGSNDAFDDVINAISDMTEEPVENSNNEKIAPEVETKVNEIPKTNIAVDKTERKKHERKAKKIVGINQETTPKEKNTGDNVRDKDNHTEGKKEVVAEINEEAKAPVIDNTDKNVSKDTVDEINHMYEDVTKLFDIKKKEADAREQRLNQYYESIQKKEEDLEIQRKMDEKELQKKSISLEAEFENKTKELEKEHTRRLIELENEFKEKQLETDKKLEAFAVERSRLDLEWKKLDVEKSTLEEKMKSLEEQKYLSEKYNISPDENIATESVGKTISEQDYTNLQEEYNSLVDENNAIIDENDALQDEVDKLTKTSDALKEEISNKDKLIEEYKEKIANSSNVSSDNLVSSNEEFNKLKADYQSLMAERDSYKETAEKLRDNEVSSVSEVNELKSKNEKLIEECNELKQKLEDNQNTGATQVLSTSQESAGAKAIRIKNELAQIGLDFNVVVGEGGATILSCEHKNCTLCINTQFNVLYIEKEVKKPSKYIKTFEQWNVEDIRVAYMVAGQKAICKYTFSDDVLRATKEIVDRFDNIV